MDFSSGSSLQILAIAFFGYPLMQKSDLQRVAFCMGMLCMSIVKGRWFAIAQWHTIAEMAALRCCLCGGSPVKTEETQAISERDGGTLVERASQNAGSLPSPGG